MAETVHIVPVPRQNQNMKSKLMFHIVHNKYLRHMLDLGCIVCHYLWNMTTAHANLLSHHHNLHVHVHVYATVVLVHGGTMDMKGTRMFVLASCGHKMVEADETNLPKCIRVPGVGD